MKKTLLYRACELEEASSPFAIVTILHTTGSSSRSRASMLVEKSGAITSTIGGGALEAYAIEQARSAIQQGGTSFVVSFTVDQEAKKGAGEVSLFIHVVGRGEDTSLFSTAQRWEQQGFPFVFGFSIEPTPSCFLFSPTQGSVGTEDKELLQQAEKTLLEGYEREIFHSGRSYFLTTPLPLTNLLIIGGGHVSQAIAIGAETLGYSYQVVETRKEYARRNLFASAKQIVVKPTIKEGLSQCTISLFTYTVVASHYFDQEALEYLLTTSTPYIGILGSRLKARMLFSRLTVPPPEKKRVFCPIGLDIGTETPSEIALSVLAQILKERSGRSGKALRDSEKNLVVVRGGGDLASGVIMRLMRAGFSVVVLEIERPTVIRTTVSFAQAMFDKAAIVEEMFAKRCTDVEQAIASLEKGIVPLLVDPKGVLLKQLNPICIVDAILAKKNLGTTIDDAPLVIALGPGFTAGKDCHVVIETKRGHSLGRIIKSGEAIANTGIPGIIAGYGRERVVHSPAEGVFSSNLTIGTLVEEGEVIATVGEQEVVAPLAGKLRGLLNSGIAVPVGFKIADIDPRGVDADHTTISDKAMAIGGSVLEVLVSFLAHQ